MDAFEQLVSQILSAEGYWVRQSFKVELTPEDKRKIKRPSSPRWELDVVAYRADENCIYVVECKSYLDSAGVRLAAFDGSNPKAAKLYKLFNETDLRHVVFERLRAQLLERRACRENPKVQLVLACGKIRNLDRAKLQERFDKNGWMLWDEDWIRDGIRKLATESYENQVSSVVAKLMLRDKSRTTVKGVKPITNN